MSASDPRSELRLDFSRADRLGLGEAIFCQGKSVAQIEAALLAAQERDASFLLTRLAPDVHEKLSAPVRGKLDYDETSRTAFFGGPVEVERSARVAIVAAGTSDAPAAREAERTLRYNGYAATMIFDVGVAGLWRLLERAEDIAAHPVVIVAAGMDAALPSVVGGIAPGVVIALPTSTGYGAARNGETALMSSLVSCAPGVAVVNIDNGYGAAAVAVRALKMWERAPADR